MTSRNSDDGSSSPITLSPTISLSNFSEVTGPDCSTSPPSPNNPRLGHEAGQEPVITPGGLGQGLIRSPSFYFEEDMVEIRVENTLFRIPRIFLTLQSEYFRTIFDEQDAKGITGPLQLLGATPTAFESLLHVLYPRKLGKTQISSVDEWTSVLDLATKWGFADVRVLAIGRLAPIASPIEKIVLARAHGLDHWLEDAYAAVCSRPAPLTLEEVRQLAPEDVVKICAAREAAARGGGSAPYYGPGPPAECGRDPGVAAQAPTPKAKAQDLAGPKGQQPARDPILPTTTVVEVVERGLALLAVQDPESQQQGYADIVDAVRRSDKRGDTVHEVLALVISAGMTSRLGEGARYAAVCESIEEILNPAHPFARVGSLPQPLLGTKAVVSYTTAICESMVDYGSVVHATTSDAPMRQAAFCANLFEKSLVGTKFVSGWWNVVGPVYRSKSKDNIRSYCTFLSAVGHLIDLPDVWPEANTTFLFFFLGIYWNALSDDLYSDDSSSDDSNSDDVNSDDPNSGWDKIHLETQTLVGLWARGWSKT